MANRAYLNCYVDGERRPRELVCKYSIAEGWLLLFAPEELFAGAPAPWPGLGEPSSYLLADAKVAVDRWTNRVVAAGFSLEGDGVMARLHEVLRADFSQGQLYVDTTELEWMDEPGFVAGLRRQLQGASVYEPEEDGIVSEYGWGTGLSPLER